MACLLVLPLVLLASACNPILHGECVTQADCGDESVCHSGLCVHPDAVPDGGDESDGGGGDGGTTLLPSIVSPAPGLLFGPVDLPVTLNVPEEAGFDTISVALLENELIVVEAPAAHDGEHWLATVALGDDAVESGAYELIAIGAIGERFYESDPIPLTVDRTPPSLLRFDPIVPTRIAGHPASDAFVLGEEVVLEVEIADDGAGVTTAPVLAVRDVKDLTGEAKEPGTWRFRFPSRAIGHLALTTSVDATITLTDDLGNSETITRAFRIDRRAWRWENPEEHPVTAAPAIVGDLLVFGDKAGHVYAVDRHTGATVWTHDTGHEIVGHVASDGSELFVALVNGEVVWLDPKPDAAEREVFRCPNDGSVTAAPPAGGVAMATLTVERNGVSTPETHLAYVTTGGRLRLLRKSGFARPAPQTGSVCAIETTLEDATQDGVVPALRTDGEAVLAQIALASGKVVGVRIEDDGTGSLSIAEDWQFTLPFLVKATASLTEHDGTTLTLVSGLLTTQGNKGRVAAVRSNGTKAWETNNSGQFSNASVDATAVATGAHAWVMNRSGLLVRLSLADGGFGPTNALPTRDPGTPRSTAVLGDDGTVYAPSGPRLTAASGSGSTLWSFDTRPPGTNTSTEFVDGVTPALDCDGRLFIAVNHSKGSSIAALVTDSSGLARSGWPKGGRDSRNTFHFEPGERPTCAD